ncbi:hypothetical protein A3758_23145, partial [Oleiphilus sp. HI0118]
MSNIATNLEAKELNTNNALSMSVAKIDQIFKQQQEKAISLRLSTLEQRREILKRFLMVVERHQPDIIEAGKKDFNKPESETLVAEIFPVVHEIKHTLKHLKKWMKAKPVPATKATLGTKSKIVYEPKGVSLIISPWNYPFNLTLGPLVSSIAAGNTAMIKSSELTPNMSRVIAKIVKEAFDEDHATVFEGEVDVSLALLEKPFDHIFFTGSPQVGKSVMAAAAKNLSSVTLELGGKSPVVVDKSANLKKSAGKITWGKFVNNGQTCVAPDYLFVHEDVAEEFVDHMKATLVTFYGDNVKDNEDYGRIVNERHTQRIKGLIEDAVQHGGKIICGGDVNICDCFIAPTLISGKLADEGFINCTLMQEEIFGPVLPIITYRDLDEVVNHINRNHKPLALYIYSETNDVSENILCRTSSGGAC